MSRIAAKVATQPPETFREAMQLIWLVHQSIHIEGHGYSCTPDRIDQLLLPFYEADRKAGRLDDARALRLIENFVLKMYDNSFWGPEHHLTQGLCLSGSSADGRDQTNRLSWLFVEGATNLALPEPLVWIRWHATIDPEVFRFLPLASAPQHLLPHDVERQGRSRRARSELGVSREDAFNYVAGGLQRVGRSGEVLFQSRRQRRVICSAIEAVLSDGKGYQGQWKWRKVAPPPAELATFDQFAAAVGAYMRRQHGAVVRL